MCIVPRIHKANAPKPVIFKQANVVTADFEDRRLSCMNPRKLTRTASPSRMTLARRIPLLSPRRQSRRRPYSQWRNSVRATSISVFDMSEIPFTLPANGLAICDPRQLGRYLCQCILVIESKANRDLVVDFFYLVGMADNERLPENVRQG